MNLFELFVKIGVDDQASQKLSDISSKLGNGLKTAAKIGTAAVGAAAAGIAALTKAAVDNYAEYEQLVGGAQLMFGNAYETVAKNAQEAYKTVQMSQNEYLQQVNGFATGLKTALGGNEQAAAELADRIITAEADIIAATGNTAENVQNAFNGIMKSNFTMLDNLQIGITPTKEGFQEVIDKVNDWNAATGNATNYQMGNLADMQSALVDYIEMQGYAGYASREAANTITGSLAAAKSAWKNLVIGLADNTADIEKLVDNLVATIVGDGTESNLGVLGNIMPAVKRALNGVSKLVSNFVPKVIKEIPSILKENLPILIKAAVSVAESLIESIEENKDMLFDMIFGLVAYIGESLISLLPKIVKLGLYIIVSLAEGLAKNLPSILPAVTGIVSEIVKILTDKKTLSNLLTAALSIIGALVDYLLADDTLDQLIDSAVTIIITITELLIENVGKLFDAAVKIIEKLVEYITDPDNLMKILSAGATILGKLGEGLLSAIGSIGETIAGIADFIFDKFLGIDLSEAGKKVLQSFLSGLAGPIMIHPSIVTSNVQGIINGSHKTGLDYVPYDGYIAELHKGERVLTASEARGYVGTTIDSVVINVNGANYEDEQSLARAIAQEIQNMTDRRAAVYG